MCILSIMCEKLEEFLAKKELERYAEMESFVKAVVNSRLKEVCEMHKGFNKEDKKEEVLDENVEEE